ncbi:MAG: hypothetical protein ABI700_32670, partial [Chloroflexota bacterium]
MKRVLWLIALILVVPSMMGAHSRAPLQDTSTPEAGSSWCVAVWYPSSDAPGGLDSIQSNTDLIRVINAFWYVPLPDGTLQTTNAAAENETLIAQWRSEGLPVMG